MRIFTKLTIAAACVAACASTTNAQGRGDLLWIAGDGVNSGWSLDDATAIATLADNDKVYSGTVYLNADKDFKFLTTYDFGNAEWRPVDANAVPGADGVVKMALCTGDDADNKIHVTESGNYLITLNAETGEATIVKSVYQETEIPYASMFIVGDALETGYSVDNGLTMIQNPQKPYEFTAAKADLKAGEFKIATIMKGAGTWNAKYWYTRDVTDSSKMVINAEGDNKWAIEDAGEYDVTANIVANTLAIEKSGDSGIGEITAEKAEIVGYYDFAGRRVVNPVSGSMVIAVDANGQATKVIF